MEAFVKTSLFFSVTVVSDSEIDSHLRASDFTAFAGMFKQTSTGIEAV